MKEKIEQIRQQALAAIEDAAGMDKLNDVKVAFLGKKGTVIEPVKRNERCSTGRQTKGRSDGK